MLHPSYTDLLQVVNQDVEEGATDIVNSRYSIVVATSRRARQLINGELPMVMAKECDKPLSIAIEELNSSRIKILAADAVEGEEDEDIDLFDDDDLILSHKVTETSEVTEEMEALIQE